MSEPLRDPRPEWMQRKHSKTRDTPFAGLLASTPRCTGSGDHGHARAIVITTTPDGAPITTEDQARQIVSALYRSRPRQGSQYLLSIPKPETVALDDGTYQVRACVHDKAAGNAVVDQRRRRGEQLAYDRTAIPKMRELRRLAKQAADSQVAEEVRERAKLEARQWGQAWEDVRNWEVDHALAPPRTGRERADRQRSAEAGQHIELEYRERARAGAILPWQEERPGRPATTRRASATAAISDYIKQIADKAEADRIRDRKLAEQLASLRDARKTRTGR